jgi:predicted dehydrogenase
MKRKIRMGMVGGGRGAFIGAVHRMAAALDGQIELVCGAFNSNAEASRASGADLFLPASRSYGSYTEMMKAEASLPEGERMDFVAVVTPNDLHVPVARAALEAGFPVFCDKPLAKSLEEAQQLAKVVQTSDNLFCVSYNYTGYPLVKEARERVRAVELGQIRRVVVEYPQGWLAQPIEGSGQKQASWRTDPARAGISCCMGDIGTHAFNLAEYVSGKRVTELCADLSSFVPGRMLDDDGSVLLRFEGGARGLLTASQIAVDEENGLAIRVYGDKGGLEWRQEEPNSLVLKDLQKPRRVLRTGGNYGHLSQAALGATRLPSGHPEGFVEAFANLYREFARGVALRLAGEPITTRDLDVPSIVEGVRGMAFVEAVVRSSHGTDKWTRLTL